MATGSQHHSSSGKNIGVPGVFSPPAALISKPQPGHTNFHPVLARFPSGAEYTMGSGSGGRSSEGGLPFFSAYTTTESAGKPAYAGVTASVGWSGFWAATLNRSATSLRITAGQGEFCAPIGPGDAFTFPRVLLVEWSGDSPQVGVNAHRRVVVDHKLPRDASTGQPVGMVSESNGCSDRCGGADSWRVFNLTTQLWHLEALQKTGVEGLWMDASWFKGDFGPNGNWQLPLESIESPSFPGGLGVIGRKMHNPPPGVPQKNFIVWIEPERVSAGSYISDHFEAPKLLGSGSGQVNGGSRLVNLGDRDMRDYLIQFVNAAVESFELDTFRTDFNIGPLAYWRDGDVALAARDQPPPPPPHRTCPKVTTMKGDIPAGKWGPAGTVDICQFAQPANLTADACGAACCANSECKAFVWAKKGQQQPKIEGACPGKQMCDSASGNCCFLKGGTGLKVKPSGPFVAGTVEDDPLGPATRGVSMGVTENLYNHGLYTYWDAIRAKGATFNPAFAIDNCASGGNRIDLESLSRTVFLWRNDRDNGIMFAGNDPVAQQADTLGLSAFAPVNNGNIHCKHYPQAPDVSSTALDPYIWRGASMTGGGIHSSEDFWTWVLAEPARIATLQAAVAERQSLRGLAISGDYWVLSPTIGGAPTELANPTKWAAWQLHDPLTNTGCVTLLRRPNATEPTLTLGLRGIEAGARYNVSMAHGFAAGEPEAMAGAKLAGLAVALEPSTSVVVRYHAL